MTTGASYSLHDDFHESFESPSVPAPNYVIAFRGMGWVTSTTPGLSFTLRSVIHLVHLPSGEFNLTKNTESVECR